LQAIAGGGRRGIDLDAKRNGQRWITEAEGYGSLNPMRVNYFISLAGELLQRMDDEETEDTRCDSLLDAIRQPALLVGNDLGHLPALRRGHHLEGPVNVVIQIDTQPPRALFQATLPPFEIHFCVPESNVFGTAGRLPAVHMQNQEGDGGLEKGFWNTRRAVRSDSGRLRHRIVVAPKATPFGGL
jgi:hypothetical protein